MPLPTPTSEPPGSIRAGEAGSSSGCTPYQPAWDGKSITYQSLWARGICTAPPASCNTAQRDRRCADGAVPGHPSLSQPTADTEQLEITQVAARSSLFTAQSAEAPRCSHWVSTKSEGLPFSGRPSFQIVLSSRWQRVFAFNNLLSGAWKTWHFRAGGWGPRQLLNPTGKCAHRNNQRHVHGNDLQSNILGSNQNSCSKAVNAKRRVSLGGLPHGPCLPQGGFQNSYFHSHELPLLTMPVVSHGTNQGAQPEPGGLWVVGIR